MSKIEKVFIGSGEVSGDKIGEKIVHEIRKINPKTEFFGITGPAMKGCGVKELFPISDISLIGLFEIVTKIPKVLNRINIAAKSILDGKPDLVVTIDSYDFFIRVAKKVKKIDSSIKFFHFVAPLAWIYRKNRAEKMAIYYDALFCIFPFEVDFFKKAGMKKVYFIGNPILDNLFINAAENKEKKDNNLIYVTIGSREREIHKHLPIIQQLTTMISQFDNKIRFFVPVIDGMSSDILDQIRLIPNVSVSNCIHEKIKNLKSASMAIAKSGTNTMEIAAFGLPMMIYYQVNLATLLFSKFILKIKYVSMINTYLNESIIPEFVDNSIDIKKMFDVFLDLKKDNKLIATKQKQAVSRVMKEFRLNEKKDISNMISLNIKD